MKRTPQKGVEMKIRIWNEEALSGAWCLSAETPRGELIGAALPDGQARYFGSEAEAAAWIPNLLDAIEEEEEAARYYGEQAADDAHATEQDALAYEMSQD